MMSAHKRIPDLPIVLKDSTVQEIARTHSKTPAQVLLRHLMQQDVIVIPKSVSQKRIQENFQVGYSTRSFIIFILS